MSQANEVDAQAAEQQRQPLRPNEFNLVWVDMEMTGLDPDKDRIIEIAVIVTDSNLNILGEGPVFAIHQPDEVLDSMDAWNKGTHDRSGLIERVKASTVTEADAEATLIEKHRQQEPNRKTPKSSKTKSQDRRFM